MQEFGTVMSKHFTALGESQQSQQPQSKLLIYIIIIKSIKKIT